MDDMGASPHSRPKHFLFDNSILKPVIHKECLISSDQMVPHFFERDERRRTKLAPADVVALQSGGKLVVSAALCVVLPALYGTHYPQVSFFRTMAIADLVR